MINFIGLSTSKRFCCRYILANLKRLPPHLKESTHLSKGYNLARTKYLLIFLALRNDTMGPGVKTQYRVNQGVYERS